MDSCGPIEEFQRGKFIVRGQVHSENGDGVGKDIRLIGTEVTEWKERKGHLLTSEMITGVFDLGLETLIIGNGVEGKLDCPEKVKRSIKRRGIPNVVLLRTPKACKLYNDLFSEGLKVAMLAHGTC